MVCSFGCRDCSEDAHREVRALVAQHVQLVLVEVLAALLVVHEAVVLPAVLQAGDHVVEFGRALVAQRMFMCSSR
jgi:hypothetical protein